jgi:hypothetical protein
LSFRLCAGRWAVTTLEIGRVGRIPVGPVSAVDACIWAPAGLAERECWRRRILAVGFGKTKGRRRIEKTIVENTDK